MWLQFFQEMHIKSKVMPNKAPVKDAASCRLILHIHTVAAQNMLSNINDDAESRRSGPV